jgi:hypothetical protein
MKVVNLQFVLGFKVLDYHGSIFRGQAELKQCSTFKGEARGWDEVKSQVQAWFR